MSSLLKQIEKDDEDLAKLKAANAEDIIDEAEEVAANVSAKLRYRYLLIYSFLYIF